MQDGAGGEGCGQGDCFVWLVDGALCRLCFWKGEKGPENRGKNESTRTSRTKDHCGRHLVGNHKRMYVLTARRCDAVTLLRCYAATLLRCDGGPEAAGTKHICSAEDETRGGETGGK